MTILKHPCKDTCSGWKQGYDEGTVSRDDEIAWLKDKLKIAISALKSCVGYEPFEGSLEPRYASEALQKLNEGFELAMECAKRCDHNIVVTLKFEGIRLGILPSDTKEVE